MEMQTAHANTVVRSINLEGETICVDVFRRPDGTFGFEEYRRDPEDTCGWYAIGHHGAEVFTTYDKALAKAVGRVPWLSGALVR